MLINGAFSYGEGSLCCIIFFFKVDAVDSYGFVSFSLL